MASSIETRALSKVPFSYWSFANPARTPARAPFHCFLAYSFCARELDWLELHPASAMRIAEHRVAALNDANTELARRMRAPGAEVQLFVHRCAEAHPTDGRHPCLVNDRGLGGGEFCSP